MDVVTTLAMVAGGGAPGVSSNLSVQYLLPIPAGSSFEIEAAVVRRGRRQVVTEAKIWRSSSAMADLALDLDFLPYPDIAVSRGGFLYLSSTLGPPQVALVALCQPGRSAACSRPLENAGKHMQGRGLQVLKKFSLGNILCSTGLSEPAPEVRVRALEILEAGHEPLPAENAAEAGANFVVQLEKKEPPASGRFFSGQVAGSSVSEVYCASYEFRAPSRGREIPGRDSQLHALERRFAARMDALERTLCGALSDLSASVCTRLDALEAKVATVAQAHPRS